MTTQIRHFIDGRRSSLSAPNATRAPRFGPDR